MTVTVRTLFLSSIFCLSTSSVTLKANHFFEQKSFVIVMLTHNNAQNGCAKSLRSVLDLDYPLTKYRVLLIDDASDDKTEEILRETIASHPKGTIVTYITNSQRRGAMENHVIGAYTCHERDIIVHIDNDDLVIRKDMLKIYNDLYNDPVKDVWMTYGSYIMKSNGKPGYSRRIPPGIIESNSISEYDWVTSHVRTFYAKLFREIDLWYFLYNSEFIPVVCDLAFMLRMVELAGEHAYFVPTILYEYNDMAPHNDHKLYLEKVLKLIPYIRRLPPLQPLEKLF